MPTSAQLKTPSANKSTGSYGKRPKWQWVVIYLVVAVVVYGLIYFIFMHHSSSSGGSSGY